MIVSMPILPDCTRCGYPVVLEVDHEDAREVCTGCGLAWQPNPVFGGIPQAVRAVKILAAHGDLQPVFCRACERGDCGLCHGVRCTCPAEHVREVPDVAE